MQTTRKPNTAPLGVGIILVLAVLVAFSLRGTAIRVDAGSPSDQPAASPAATAKADVPAVAKTDPPPGMHYSDVGELVPGALPNGQTETPAPDEPATVAEVPKNLPFTPAGSPKMVGRWGRNMNMILNAPTQDDAVKSAHWGYDEYDFKADGSFTDIGHWLGGERRLGGYYYLASDGVTLHMSITYRYENGQRVELVPDHDTKKLHSISSWPGFLAFDDLAATFLKDFWWDDTLCSYVDSQGKSYASYSRHLGLSATQANQMESMDQQVQTALKAEFGDNKPFRIDYWGGDDFRVHAIDEAGRVAAENWLKKHGFYHGTGEVFLATHR